MTMLDHGAGLEIEARFTLSSKPVTLEGAFIKIQFLEACLENTTNRLRGAQKSFEKERCRAEHAERTTREMAVQVERLKRLLAEALSAPEQAA
jgi:hypothetical protein